MCFYNCCFIVDEVEILIVDYDLVLDGIDNFDICYLVNVVCVVLGKFLIFGVLI